MNKITHGVCEHILDKCSIRDIVYYNIFTDRSECLTICNEWYKLNFIDFCKNQKYPHISDHYLTEFTKSIIVENILQREESFILETTRRHKVETNYKQLNPFKQYFSIEMCRRPRLYWTFDLIDLIKIQIELLEKKEYDRQYILYRKLISIFKDIKLNPLYNIWFLKNPKIKPIINKIINSINSADYLNIEVNNLLITILNNAK